MIVIEIKCATRPRDLLQGTAALRRQWHTPRATTCPTHARIPGKIAYAKRRFSAR